MDDVGKENNFKKKFYVLIHERVNIGKKKTPAVKQKKASSATARKSSKKVSPDHTDLNGSFIQSVIPVEPDPTAASSSSQLPHTQDKWDSILTMLQRLEESNQAIMKGVSDLESQKSVNSAVRNPQLQPDVNTDIPQNNMHSLTSTLVLASYEAQARQDVAQGKAPTKKSGRYNTTKAVASIPELR